MALNVTAGVGTTLKSRLDASDHVVSHDCIQSGSWSVTITGLPGSLVGYAEDSVHSSGHVGLMTLVVRSDAGGSLVGTDGDYAPLQVDANGALRVTGGGGGTEYTEDAAAAANPVGAQLILRRRDTLSGSEVSADGDVIAANATAKGELHVKHTDSVAITAASLPLPTGAASETTLAVIAGYLDTEVAAVVTALQLLDNAIIGSEMQVDIVGALPAGANVIGGVTQSGTWTVDLGATDNAVLDDIAAKLATIDADTSTLAAAVAGTEVQVDVLTLPALPAGSNTIGNVGVLPVTSGGCTGWSAISTAAVLSVEIKNAAGQVYGIQVFNTNAAPRFVRIYNQTGAPGSGDAANIVWRGIIPGNTAGAGFQIPLPGPIACSTGIGIRASAAIADNDTTVLAANELVFNVQYK